MIRLSAFAALTPALLAGCVAPATSAGEEDCAIVDSRDWAAWVSAMPGPTAPSLIVTGKVTVPTGGYRIALELGPVQEIHPPVQQVLVRAEPPAGAATQALVEHDVRGAFPALDEYGAVSVRCGARVLATVSPVERAY